MMQTLDILFNDNILKKNHIMTIYSNLASDFYNNFVIFDKLFISVKLLQVIYNFILLK